MGHSCEYIAIAAGAMRRWIAAASLALLVAGAAHAQSEEEFVGAFAGEWQVVDARYVEGTGPCRLTLGREARQPGRYDIELQSCGGFLALVGSWGIADGQMSLFDESGAVVAKLGGSQRRMSGNAANGDPVIIEKAGLPGMANMLEAARRASGCFYAGFTDNCAPVTELSKPEGEELRLNVLVNLNVRSEARDEASALGTIPANSCISADLCMEATDGVWCRAQFDGRSGWFRKLALRQNRWPVVTFFNSCSPG